MMNNYGVDEMKIKNENRLIETTAILLNIVYVVVLIFALLYCIENIKLETPEDVKRSCFFISLVIIGICKVDLLLVYKLIKK